MEPIQLLFISLIEYFTRAVYKEAPQNKKLNEKQKIKQIKTLRSYSTETELNRVKF